MRALAFPPLDPPALVVIIEDEPDIALLATLAVHDVGLTARVFTDSTKTILPGAFDDAELAIIDLRMPDVSGIKVLEHLVDSYPHVIRVVCTANYELAGVAAQHADAMIPKLALPTAGPMIRALIEHHREHGRIPM